MIEKLAKRILQAFQDSLKGSVEEAEELMAIGKFFALFGVLMVFLVAFQNFGEIPTSGVLSTIGFVGFCFFIGGIILFAVGLKLHDHFVI